MTPLPHFQLYGEGASFADPGFVHVETIASRSARNDWNIRPHSHDTLDQLLFVRGGTIEARIEDTRWTSQTGAVVHVPAGHVHGFVFSADIDGDVATFSTELRESLQASQPDAREMIAGPLMHGGADNRFDSLLKALHMECSGHARGRIAAAGWIVGLLLIQVARLAGEPGAQAADPRLTVFRGLVDAHFAEHRPVSFYADRLAMTERSLGRFTRARFGCSPIQYLHRRLLLEARRQLIYGTQPIARIADELGFADPSYFTRFYQRMTGELPSEVRASTRS